MHFLRVVYVLKSLCIPTRVRWDETGIIPINTDTENEWTYAKYGTNFWAYISSYFGHIKHRLKK